MFEEGSKHFVGVGGGGGSTCDSQIENKENQGSKDLPRRRKKKKKPKVAEMLSSHSFPSETLTLWRVEREDGKLPPHTGRWGGFARP